jgi:GH43 family beta-xylosidase
MTGATRGRLRGRRRRFVGSAVLAAVAVLMPVLPAGAAGKVLGGGRGAKWFSNPVLGPGQDPSVMSYGGWYYYTQSSPDTTYISIRRSRSIKSLAASVRHVVWRGGKAGSPCCDWWAPELHVINNRWYIYTTADNGTNDSHRLQVLEARSPLGRYVYKGQLTTPGDFWSIDPSPLQLPNRKLFLFWSGWPGTTNGIQNIYIARMSNPWTVSSGRTVLSTPTYPWEMHPNPAMPPATPTPVYVNESPEPILHQSTISVTYSGSGCFTPNYALGLLTARVHSDLLNPASWTKSPTPIFQSNPAADIYAPASNGWFMSPDGRQTWFAFHAVNDKAGNCGWERNVYAQRVTWTANGSPNLGGMPHPLTTPVRVPTGDPGAP